MKKILIDNTIITFLAREMAESMQRFYSDPKNEAKYQEWLKQKKEPSECLTATGVQVELS